VFAFDEKGGSKSASSLDDELLKGLGPDPLEDVRPAKPEGTKPEGAKPQAKKTSAEPQRSKAAGSEALDDELLKGLGDEPASRTGSSPDKDSDHPLLDLNRKMRESEQLMRATNGGEETQDLQKEIVRRLEKLIDELEQQQQQQQSSSASRQKPSQQESADNRPQSQPQSKSSGHAQAKPAQQPARDSSGRTVKRETAKPDMAQMREMLKDIWGELPPRLRQQMMQSSIEKFIPKYELLIEEYFKALAEKQRDGGGAP
jgi:hypothetical protein